MAVKRTRQTTKMPRKAGLEERAEAATVAFKALLLALRTKQPKPELDRRWTAFGESLAKVYGSL